jgi:hypothetical protein
MRLLQSLAVACLLVAGAATFAPTQAAAATLDTPRVTFLDNSPAYIKLMVTAGPSGTPYGFTVEWMSKSDFDLYGWPTDYMPPSFNYCTFDGVPSFNVTPGVADFLLGPNVGAKVVLGELFDESGLYTTYVDEMAPETQYVLRARAEGGPGGGASSNSANVIVSSGTHEICRFTQGYWKNHPSAWPAGCLPMLLGTNAYTEAQLISILETPSSTGPCGTANGLLILVHQLIAAKLNSCLATPPPSIAAAIATADGMIGGLVPPPFGTGCLPPPSVDALSTELDDFNNGKTDGDKCTTATKSSTWGRVKALYR